MNTTEFDEKQERIAAMIDGKVVPDTGRVAVCVEGVIDGFPAKFEAFQPTWPFGVMYTVETNVVVDPNQPDNRPVAKIQVYPRMGRGFFTIFTRILLFEAKGQPVSNRKLEKQFSFNYDERIIAERFINHPGVAEVIEELDYHSKFSELVIKTDVGVYLAQPTNFNALELDTCKATFDGLTELAEVLFEGF
jgi:hypothetical protein